ncbi:methyl-accepting chemotaxis protein [Photobacterium sp. GJ3]|uniref:methyl-accepting chemotaxis protein n=1 Tax=Photobacterium sp. GJ3 TaxID=2829502 RepID=UPI001B8AF03B|nr:PAS domain-containing methyl-accepting chemotaxis protein [Photobacterium sp. GJ3]QUJ68483.1 methyl-accepting chemotaxis protein [Photobacterium sp. GJ3]
MRKNRQVTDREVVLDHHAQLVTTTDLQGVITYANDEFVDISGYSFDELVGQHHNIIRHPDMPRAAFGDLWSHLKSEKPWRGIVKNRCKDGSYYWVDAYVTPLYENNKVCGYQSVRRKPTSDMIETAAHIYQQLNQNKNPYGFHLSSWSKLGLTALLTAMTVGLLNYFIPEYDFLSAALPFAFIAILCRGELFAVPRFFQQLSDNYDALTRIIYSGNGPASIADFHLKLDDARLKTVLGRIDDAATTIKGVTDELTDITITTRDSISNQDQDTQHIATAITQMSAVATEIAQNTQLTTEKVLTAQQKCADTTKVLGQTQNNINDLARDTENAAQTAQSLVKVSEQIETMMLEIQGIAEQTNLLALNAAIEAARAGEQGRGFAVVADEVRALSQRTHGATENIQASIVNISATLNQWQSTSAESIEKTHQCVAHTNETAASIMEVVAMVDEIAEISTQIAAAAEEQGTVAQEISSNVHQISTSSSNNLTMMSRMEEAATKMRAKVASLEGLSKSFG